MMLRSLFHRDTSVSAKYAKERLKIILAHERCLRYQADFLPRMQQELLEVIKRYMPIDADHVKVQMEQQDTLSILEINVTLPEDLLSNSSS